MNISMPVLAKAETKYGACTDMMNAAEDISAYINNVHGQKVIIDLETDRSHNIVVISQFIGN